MNWADFVNADSDDFWLDWYPSTGRLVLFSYLSYSLEAGVHCSSTSCSNFHFVYFKYICTNWDGSQYKSEAERVLQRKSICIFESSKSESLNHAYLNQTKV